jgi:hypothetical protein
MNKSQHGSHIVIVLIIVAVVGIVAALGWAFISQKENKNHNDGIASQNSEDNGPIWQQTAEGWRASRQAPDCPAQPMLKAPADLSKATSVLYPGQTRGQYKPHGGLRFDTITDNNITVTSPFDGYVVKATRNFAQGTTEIQYGFDIMSDCGVMTRLGHLREIPDNLQAIVSKLPEASENSRIENVNPPVRVKQGDVLATKVGLISEKNTFFDWGVYDYREQNAASRQSSYQSAHPQKELDWYGVCWLTDWLPASDVSLLSKLPAGAGENGKTSDYCQ